MRRVPLFVKAAVVSSSATLLACFVALKAGLLDEFVHAATPDAAATPVGDPPAEFMPGSKYAPIGLHRADPRGQGSEETTTEGTSEIMEKAHIDVVRAYSSKSSVPLIDPERVQFPPKPEETAAKGAPRPMLMPSSKRAEVFDFTPKMQGKSAKPVTMLPGSKSFTPLIEVPPPAVPKAAPQTYSKGYKRKGD